ncbi:hypothetical protein ANO11243_055360 [Dothideomycetidae sp. 11243]|nr:hypothetical protein ANO11243_055360 [fungal sp. No.11243]
MGGAAAAAKSTANYYNFSNIRYGAPPVRFAAPQAPAPNRTVVQSGQDTRVCPQANPTWEAIAAQLLPAYLLGQRPLNSSSYTQPNLTIAPDPPFTSEDCLFLDVFVPQSIWNRRNSGNPSPVLVWIYGGGYTFGSKTSSGSPAGLLTRSQNNSQPGVIYVAMNYRLGAFGWLSGPSFQDEGGVANAGFYDQRLALEWVQKYIYLFGGDPNQVTVFGESAGGGSVMHQITAYGGTQGPSPFQQAIPQSPGFQVIVSANQQETTYQNYLKAANVTSLAEAQNLSYADAQMANAMTIATAAYGTFTYGPVVDGIFTPSIPAQLLARGQYDKNLSIMVGQNQDEGLLFTNPLVLNDVNDTMLRQQLYANIPTLRGLPDQVDYILNTLYPPIYNGTQAMNYTDQVKRAAAITSEFAFICNTFYLDEAYGNNSYSYLFDVPPALHGMDIPYTYYTGNGSAGSIAAPSVALEMQDYITSFAQHGMPNEDGVPVFNMYGPNAQVQVLQASGVSQMMDPAANKRCNYWRSAIWS